MARLERVVLSDLSHLLPMPGGGSRMFPRDAAGLVVDVEAIFWRKCLRDRSVRLHTAPGPEKPAPAAAEGPAQAPPKKRKQLSGESD